MKHELHNMIAKSLSGLALLFSIATNVEALQFSANAVFSAPDRADVSTLFYYSTGKIRKEYYYYGEPAIQIIDTVKQIRLMCFTLQKACYETKSVERLDIERTKLSGSPCKDSQGLVCKNLGEEIINSRKAQKWELSAKTTKENTPDSDIKHASYIWIDVELNIAIKQVFQNSNIIELFWIGEELLDRRITYKWLQQIKLSSGEVQENHQWFDKELGISIKEAYPNGNIQELKNIEVIKLPDTLFDIPEGFTIIDTVKNNNSDK